MGRRQREANQQQRALWLAQYTACAKSLAALLALLGVVLYAVWGLIVAAAVVAYGFVGVAAWYWSGRHDQDRPDIVFAGVLMLLWAPIGVLIGFRWLRLRMRRGRA